VRKLARGGIVATLGASDPGEGGEHPWINMRELESLPDDAPLSSFVFRVRLRAVRYDLSFQLAAGA
jgi:hypothetical protein